MIYLVPPRGVTCKDSKRFSVFTDVELPKEVACRRRAGETKDEKKTIFFKPLKRAKISLKSLQMK